MLDRDLPGLSGDAVCRTLRAEHYPARILMLTAAAGLDDRIEGLDLGADDYLAKPFAYLELLARLRALSRREAGGGARTVLEFGGVRLDPGTAHRRARRHARAAHAARKWACSRCCSPRTAAT